MATTASKPQIDWKSWLKTAVELSELLIPLIIADAKATSSRVPATAINMGGLDWKYANGKLTVYNPTGQQFGICCTDPSPIADGLTYELLDSGEHLDLTDTLLLHPDSLVCFAPTAAGDPSAVMRAPVAFPPGTWQCLSLAVGGFLINRAMSLGGASLGVRSSTGKTYEFFLDMKNPPQSAVLKGEVSDGQGRSVSFSDEVKRGNLPSTAPLFVINIGSELDIATYVDKLELELYTDEATIKANFVGPAISSQSAAATAYSGAGAATRFEARRCVSAKKGPYSLAVGDDDIVTLSSSSAEKAQWRYTYHLYPDKGYQGFQFENVSSALSLKYDSSSGKVIVEEFSANNQDFLWDLEYNKSEEFWLIGPAGTDKALDVKTEEPCDRAVIQLRPRTIGEEAQQWRWNSV